MPRVGATAAAQHRERGHLLAQGDIPGGEIVRITLVKIGGFVEFGMAACGGVGAQPAQPLKPRPAVGGSTVDMRRVSAVHHEIRGGSVSLRIDLFDRTRHRLTRRQQTGRLNREGDRDRHGSGGRCPHDADGLLDVGDRQRGDLIGRRRRERPDLDAAIPLRLVSRHDLAGVVTVATRTDATAHHRGHAVRAGRRPDLLGEVDRRAVGGIEALR